MGFDFMYGTERKVARLCGACLLISRNAVNNIGMLDEGFHFCHERMGRVMKTVPDYYFKGQRNEVLPLLPATYKRVLEIGCGDGGFASGLLPACETWGVEPNHVVAELASCRLYKVLIGTYEEVVNQLPNRYFDLIVCNDVIEHMRDHDEFLESIKTKLAPDACLVGSIPICAIFPVFKEIVSG